MRTLCVLAIVAVVVGCQTQSMPVPTNAPATSQPSRVDPAQVTLEVVDRAGYDKVLESKRGQVVLVDAWATWCGPCKQAFPHTVALQQKFGPQGLAVVSLSLDDADAHEEALKFLTEQKAEFTNLRSHLGAEDAAIEQFEIDGGGLPHLKLYDRAGKLVRTFVTGDPDKVFTPEDIDLAIRELIAASP